MLAPSGPAAVEASPLRLGAHAASSQFFRGLVDDVRIYNSALSLSEIQQIMQTPVGGDATPAASPPTPLCPPWTLTAPAAGATVSGTVTVSATASDNVGVAGVQFLLDGSPHRPRGHHRPVQLCVEHRWELLPATTT